MLTDADLMFSDDQAITASAASTNIIDLTVAEDIGPGTPIPLYVAVKEVFNNLTSLTVKVETDSSAAFSSPKSVLEKVVPIADLIQGADLSFGAIPHGTKERYVRLYYTVTGTNPSTGKISAMVAVGLQANP